MTLASIRSRSIDCSGNPLEACDHSLNFSTIQASWPTGESLRAKPRVFGRVAWIWRLNPLAPGGHVSEPAWDGGDRPVPGYLGHPAVSVLHRRGR